MMIPTQLEVERMSKTFNVGDRVIITGAGVWREASHNRMAKLRRPGTVTRVIGTEIHPAKRGYNIAFDGVGNRKGTVTVQNAPAAYMELLEGEKT